MKKRILAIFLIISSILVCFSFTSCGILKEKEPDTIYEEKFLGIWKNEEIVFSFEYQDGAYCGGAMNRGLTIVSFDKYIATETTITLFVKEGGIKTFYYQFKNGHLYLDDIKLEKYS